MKESARHTKWNFTQVQSRHNQCIVEQISVQCTRNQYWQYSQYVVEHSHYIGITQSVYWQYIVIIWQHIVIKWYNIVSIVELYSHYIVTQNSREQSTKKSRVEAKAETTQRLSPHRIWRQSPLHFVSALEWKLNTYSQMLLFFMLAFHV